jgi:hypothetical protein
MPCYSPLKGFKSRSTGGLTFRRSDSVGERMTVACGGCLGCRLDRSREWAARIIHEAQSHDDNCFITLTYDQEHMPRLFNGGPGTLLKKDFQNFMKRLRKRLAPRKIRYYMCGEYGDKDNRPHYHACVFGFDPEDKQLFSVNLENEIYTSQMVSDCWARGFVTVGALTFQSAAYVARYVMKKITGPLAQDHYLRVDDYGVAYWLEPEYNTMSRRPGIGKDWYEEYKSDLWPSDEVPVPGTGVFKKVPRYYQTILKGEDELQYEEVRRLREEFRNSHEDEYSPQRLMDKYKVKKAQLKHLKREL